MGVLRLLVNSQLFFSDAFDELLPAEHRLDGNRHFLDEFAPRYIRSGLTIVDVGGGRQPYLKDVLDKRERKLTVIGLDISQDELGGAPPGCYDTTICADISTFRASEPIADLIICQAVLEHVRNVDGAFRAFASLIKPGGVGLIFVPSRNALFARLNLILPETVKRALLFSIYPHMRKGQGFRSYYDRCTPGEFDLIARANGFSVEQRKLYWMSGYFRFFTPLHILWRLWTLIFRRISVQQSAETFSLALRKN